MDIPKTALGSPAPEGSGAAAVQVCPVGLGVPGAGGPAEGWAAQGRVLRRPATAKGGWVRAGTWEQPGAVGAARGFGGAHGPSSGRQRARVRRDGRRK